MGRSPTKSSIGPEWKDQAQPTNIKITAYVNSMWIWLRLTQPKITKNCPYRFWDFLAKNQTIEHHNLPTFDELFKEMHHDQYVLFPISLFLCFFFWSAYKHYITLPPQTWQCSCFKGLASTNIHLFHLPNLTTFQSTTQVHPPCEDTRKIPTTHTSLRIEKELGGSVDIISDLLSETGAVHVHCIHIFIHQNQTPSFMHAWLYNTYKCMAVAPQHPHH